MRERGQGRVVNVGSIMGRVAMPLLGAYNASKHAVAALTDALRMELAPFGITVVLVEPGAIRTGFAARALAGLAPYRDPTSPYAPRPGRHRRRLGPRLPPRPRPRPGRPDRRPGRHHRPPGGPLRGPRPQPPDRGGASG
jgi:NAD(P)-dependent dehydrogenase (short-subunit alcohol dehydrogenase family)